MSALNILYHHLPIHPSLSGNFVFLCGAFWDCCHQHTCYMSLEYTGFTPRRNVASSGLSTHHTLHSDVSREHSQTVFPKHTVRKTPQKRAPRPAQPTPAGSYDTLFLAALSLHAHMVCLGLASCEDDSPEQPVVPGHWHSSLAVLTQALCLLYCRADGVHTSVGICSMLRAPVVQIPTLHVLFLSTGVPEAYSYPWQ